MVGNFVVLVHFTTPRLATPRFASPRHTTPRFATSRHVSPRHASLPPRFGAAGAAPLTGPAFFALATAAFFGFRGRKLDEESRHRRAVALAPPVPKLRVWVVKHRRGGTRRKLVVAAVVAQVASDVPTGRAAAPAAAAAVVAQAFSLLGAPPGRAVGPRACHQQLSRRFGRQAWRQRANVVSARVFRHVLVPTVVRSQKPAGRRAWRGRRPRH